MRCSATFVLLAAVLGSAGVAWGQVRDPNFTQASYATGVGSITDIAWAGDGTNRYLFITQQGGAIRVVRNGALQSAAVATVSPVVSGGELGLLGLAIDPAFATNRRIYIFVSETTSIHRIYRYTTTDSGGVMGVVGTTGGRMQMGVDIPSRNVNHNGGSLAFGPDGYLYFGSGNMGNGTGADGSVGELDTLASKIGRMMTSGAAVTTNPYYTGGGGPRDYIFSRGYRNAFGMCFKPGTSEPWILEVGDSWEHIFLAAAGTNRGYPTENNTSPTNGKLIPRLAYQRDTAPNWTAGGGTLTKGCFYSGTAFPVAYQGNLFFAEHRGGKVVRAIPNGTGVIPFSNVSLFVAGVGGVVDVETGPDGSLYYASRSNSTVYQLYYNGSTAPTISAHPQNRTVNEGQTAQFSVTAGPAGVTYQWRKTTPPGTTFADIAGATSASYTTAATTVGMTGTQYRVVVTNGVGSTTSNIATLTVNYIAPTITTQPASQSVVAPAMATFSVVATGTNRTYQWQSMPPGGAFANIGGATAVSYTTPATTTGMSGTQYRVIVTNPGGSVTSTAATLTVTAANVAPSITSQPPNRTVTAPATAAFAVTASGTAPLTYQWQSMPPGGAFANIGGATAASYTTPATAVNMSGTQYRVVVTNSVGSVTSAVATLTVNGPAAATPVILPSGGTYSGPVTVRLTTATAGATIRYTTNNTAPTGTSTAYAGPFVISANATVRAITTMAGMTNSPEGSGVFTITGNTAYGIPYRDTVTGLNIPAVAAGLPPTLSATGVFQNPVSTMTPRAGLIEFGMNSPLWSDNARKRRWIALPGTAKITHNATGEWTFPAGTILVKHFDLPINDTNPSQTKRLETRVFYIDGGNSYGATYKWRADNSEADLLTNAFSPLDEVQTITTSTGTRTQTWSYPSRENCMTCHNTAAGIVLGPKTRQLNGTYPYSGGVTDNQLRTWNYLQMFTTTLSESAFATYARLNAVDDVNATLEQRARSYFDSNCGICHRPGAPMGRAQWDGRYTTALASAGIIEGTVYADNLLGLADPKIVAGGDPANSMLLQRMMTTTANVRMPQIASHVVDDEATITITAWINTLPAVGPNPNPTPTPAPTGSSSSDNNGWGCGLTGLEGILLLALASRLRRRRR